MAKKIFMAKTILELRRIAFKKDYTIGRLYVNGVYFCDTLEPKWRNYAAGEKKVYGKSAIPEGEYIFTKHYSTKRGFFVLELHGVPNFLNVQIHPGNTAADTKGCILVGKNLVKGKVLKSMSTFESLMCLLNNCYYYHHKVSDIYKIKIMRT